jgi:hypothetical protein
MSPAEAFHDLPTSLRTTLGRFPSSKSMRCRKDFVVSLEKRQVALGDLNDIAVNEEIHRKVSTNERSRPPLSREYRLKQLVADISGYIC